MSVVLKDAANVAATFVGRSIDRASGIATFIKSTGVPLADDFLQLGLRITSGNRYKPTLDISEAKMVVETINGVEIPKIIGRNYAKTVFDFHERSTLEERQKFVERYFSAAHADNVLVTDVVVKLNGPKLTSSGT